MDPDRIPGIVPVAACRLGGGQAIEDACWVIEEEPLTIDVRGIGTYTLMWTPAGRSDSASAFTPADGLLGDAPGSDAIALAAGFAYTEGLFDEIPDIESIAGCEKTPGVVRIVLVDPARARVRRRDVVVGSSCGICGSRERVDDLLRGIAPVRATMRFAQEGFGSVMHAMRRRQAVWLATGGAHAAAIFSADAEILELAEDLGRHNALDKVIGRRLLGGRSFAGCGVALSSRVTLEMIAKAARAGFEVVCAVSAPTSLAIDVAQALGVTLCGFVRNGQATVYTHPQRLEAEAPDTPRPVVDGMRA